MAWALKRQVVVAAFGYALFQLFQPQKAILIRSVFPDMLKLASHILSVPSVSGRVERGIEVIGFYLRFCTHAGSLLDVGLSGIKISL